MYSNWSFFLGFWFFICEGSLFCRAWEGCGLLLFHDLQHECTELLVHARHLHRSWTVPQSTPGELPPYGTLLEGSGQFHSFVPSHDTDVPRALDPSRQVREKISPSQAGEAQWGAPPAVLPFWNVGSLKAAFCFLTSSWTWESRRDPVTLWWRDPALLAHQGMLGPSHLCGLGWGLADIQLWPYTRLYWYSRNSYLGSLRPWVKRHVDLDHQTTQLVPPVLKFQVAKEVMW